MGLMLEDGFFKKSTRIMLITGVVYGILCSIGSVFVLGFEPKFIVGLIMGLAIMILNYYLIGIAAGLFINKGRIDLAICIYTLRLVHYAMVAVICYLIGQRCLMGYVFGVMAIVAGGIISMIKGGRNSND